MQDIVYSNISEVYRNYSYLGTGISMYSMTPQELKEHTNKVKSRLTAIMEYVDKNGYIDYSQIDFSQFTMEDFIFFEEGLKLGPAAQMGIAMAAAESYYSMANGYISSLNEVLGPVSVRAKDLGKSIATLETYVNNNRGSIYIGGKKGTYPSDYQSKNTVQRGATFNSEREARALAREKLGKDPVNVGDNKLRSQDGRWQYRAKEGDVTGAHSEGIGHIHLEKLDPKTGEVLENWHFYWK